MTRPQAASERFVNQLPQDIRAGVSLIYSPLITIVPIASEIEFGDARGLIFSSANAVEIAAGLSRQRDLPCYCVGAATTRAASKAGWPAECSGVNSDTLLRKLRHAQTRGPLLHIRGTHTRGDLARRLRASGCPTREQVTYDQPLLPLSDAAQETLAGASPVIVPLFSPRTARQFGKLVTGPAPLFLAALSDAVADQVKPLKYRQLSVPDRPDAGAMAQLVSHMVNDAIRVEGDRPAQ